MNERKGNLLFWHSQENISNSNCEDTVIKKKIKRKYEIIFSVLLPDNFCAGHNCLRVKFVFKAKVGFQLRLSIYKSQNKACK